MTFPSDTLEYRREYYHRYYHDHPDAKKRTKLRERYGIDVSEWDTMLHKQQGLCAVCQKPMRSGRGGTCVDHDHATGRVRGLVCAHCNVRLTAIEDKGWRAMAEGYLSKTTEDEK